MNKRTLDALTPILNNYFERIDALGQKKEDKEKKIALFKEFTDMVQQLSENTDIEQIAGYDSLLSLIKLSLDEAWVNYD